MQLASYFQNIDRSSFKNLTAGLGAPIVVLAIMGILRYHLLLSSSPCLPNARLILVFSPLYC
jgi:hypothetical protein